MEEALQLLARPWQAGETGVIKPSNVVNGLAPAMLAARPEGARLDGLPGRLVRRTPATLTSRAALEVDLGRAAARGYALDLEENERGAHCVAAAIPTALAVAAVSISGPVQRLPAPALERCGAALVRSVAAIAARLG